MHTIAAILMGLIQGLTEFLPISSSGHLVLFEHFFQNNAVPGAGIAFEIFLHLGSLLAVIIYFRHDILDLMLSLFHWKQSVDYQRHSRNRMIIVYLLVATAVTGVIFKLAGDRIEAVFGKPLIVAILLSVTGLILLASDFVKKNSIPMSGMGLLRSFVIGLGQGIAMLPGISRSGTTIATSIFCGIKRADAARFSFLLSIPAILGANLGEIGTLSTLQSSQLLNYILGAMAAFVSGYLVISILLRLIQNAKLKYFAFYCWAISLISIIFILSGY